MFTTMKLTVRQRYIAPRVEVFSLPKSIHLLDSLSIESTIEDIEDGGEL